MNQITQTYNVYQSPFTKDDLRKSAVVQEKLSHVPFELHEQFLDEMVQSISIVEGPK